MKTLLDLQSIIMKDPENSAYFMLDYDINADLFRLSITNDPQCQCGAPFENSIQCLMECPLYQNERDCLKKLRRNSQKYRNFTL
jgi:hypothetical protein